MSPLCQLASVLMALALGTQAAVPQPEARPAAPPDLAIDGISLGQTFEELDDRFDLSQVYPIEREGKKRYIWKPPPDLLLVPEPQFEGRVLQALTLLFDNDRLVMARLSYSSDLAFARMGLVERYGEPTSVRALPPRRTKEREGANFRTLQVRFSEGFAVWIQVWTWEWEEVTLTVTGEHYTERDARRPAKGRHFFHFVLTATEPEP